jgi:hypothetical protein
MVAPKMSNIFSTYPNSYGMIQKGNLSNIQLKMLILFRLEKKSGLNDEEKAKLAERKAQLSQMCTKISEMERELPVRDNGLYLSIILGSNLNISLLNPDERYRYKQEYESFKLSVTCVVSSQNLFKIN